MSFVFFPVLLAGMALSATSSADEGPAWAGLRVDATRIEGRILELSRFGRNPEGGVSRVAFSDADIQGRGYIVSLMEEAGLAVRIDEAGNILGRREGTERGLSGCPRTAGGHRGQDRG
jgi:N-carbamoyl-L-amino-acid hydrolase